MEFCSRNKFREIEVFTELPCNNTNKNSGRNSFLKKEILFLSLKFEQVMFQRIQTLYMAGAILTSGFLGYVFPLWKDANGKDFFFMMEVSYLVLSGAATALIAMSIISFKNRKQQFVFNRLSIILNLILLGLLIYRSLNVSGETPTVSEKGIGMFLPIFSIVLLALANKAIKKDEDLVKSVDRIR